MDLDGGSSFDFEDLVLNVHGGVDHLGDALVVHGCKHGDEAGVASAVEDDVEGHIDLDIFATELLPRDIDVVIGCGDVTNDLVEDLDGLKDDDKVFVVCDGDVKDIGVLTRSCLSSSLGSW
ncbi:hypothetical protein JHK82_035303 [Glycine max]|nr:hypothetical protein JHK85_036028 [Glycine max]KAG5112034.1 hypothetical protein JHK82_035303 [Glycine max]